MCVVAIAVAVAVAVALAVAVAAAGAFGCLFARLLACFFVVVGPFFIPSVLT